MIAVFIIVWSLYGLYLGQRMRVYCTICDQMYKESPVAWRVVDMLYGPLLHIFDNSEHSSKEED